MVAPVPLLRRAATRELEGITMSAHDDLFKSQHGKFENKATEIVYEMTLDGGGDECGDVEGPGWFGKVEGPFDEPGLKKYKGAIIQQDNSGFVYSEFFTSKEKLKKKWKKVEDTCSSFYGDEDEG